MNYLLTNASISRNWKPPSWKSQFHTSQFFFQALRLLLLCSHHNHTPNNLIYDSLNAARIVHNFNLFFVFPEFIRREMCAHNLLRLHSAQFINRHRSSLSLSENFGCLQQRRRRLNWMRAHIKIVFINEQQPNGAAEIPSIEKMKLNLYIFWMKQKTKANNKFNAFHGAIHTTPWICAAKSYIGRKKTRNTRIYREQSMRKENVLSAIGESLSSHMDACCSCQICTYCV